MVTLLSWVCLAITEEHSMWDYGTSKHLLKTTKV